MSRYRPEDMHGLFAGQFSPEDYLPYIESGEMRVVYKGPAGFMGLGTLEQVPEKVSR